MLLVNKKKTLRNWENKLNKNKSNTIQNDWWRIIFFSFTFSCFSDVCFLKITIFTTFIINWAWFIGLWWSVMMRSKEKPTCRCYLKNSKVCGTKWHLQTPLFSNLQFFTPGWESIVSMFHISRVGQAKVFLFCLYEFFTSSDKKPDIPTHQLVWLILFKIWEIWKYTVLI